MIGSQIDERRRYGRFDKKNILKRTGGICGCCGKQLTVETMTIEHVIPISRGGLDSERNTIALCKTCNEDKGNMLYVPMWFYTALVGKPLLEELNDMFTKWFKTVKKDFDITMYPLIAPRHNLMLSMSGKFNPKHMRKAKVAYIRSSVVQWHYTGNKYKPEVEAVTGVNIKTFRRHIEEFMPVDDPPVAVYTCRKLTTDKILCLAAISVSLEQKMAVACIEWSDLPKHYKSGIYYSIVRLMFNIFQLTEYDINDITLLIPTEDEYAVDEITHHLVPGLSADLKQIVHGRQLDFRNIETNRCYAALQLHVGQLTTDDIIPKANARMLLAQTLKTEQEEKEQT